jgi:hypothetical protein
MVEEVVYLIEISRDMRKPTFQEYSGGYFHHLIFFVFQQHKLF